jgi:hypothetical protein
MTTNYGVVRRNYGRRWFNNIAVQRRQVITVMPCSVSPTQHRCNPDSNLVQFIEPGYLGPLQGSSSDKASDRATKSPRPPSPAGFKVSSSKSGKVIAAINQNLFNKSAVLDNGAFSRFASCGGASCTADVHTCLAVRGYLSAQQIDHYCFLCRTTMRPSRRSRRCTRKTHIGNGGEGQHFSAHVSASAGLRDDWLKPST